MTHCQNYAPVLPSEMNRLSPIERLRKIAAAFEEDAFTTIRISELRKLIKAADLLPDLVSYAESATLEEDPLPTCVIEGDQLMEALK